MAARRFDLPPLDLLRAFEAAARNLSFTRAADELFVTQSAVSRQIKALEEHLGTPLFERRHRALVLNDAGQALYRGSLAALEQIQQAIRQVRQQRSRRTFTVTTTVGFASLWLVPRLPQFTAAHPEVDVRISATNDVMHLERDDIDVAIRYLPREKAEGARLFGEQVEPVCSPALLRDRSRPLVSPRDLERHVLLMMMEGPRSPWLEWPLWLRSVGVADLRPAGAMHFSQYDHLITAAIAGQGVALGRMPLLRDAVRDGRLVLPFRRSVVSPRSYYLIESPRSAGLPVAAAFREWMQAEAAADLAAERSATASPAAAPARTPKSVPAHAPSPARTGTAPKGRSR